MADQTSTATQAQQADQNGATTAQQGAVAADKGRSVLPKGFKRSGGVEAFNADEQPTPAPAVKQQQNASEQGQADLTKTNPSNIEAKTGASSQDAPSLSDEQLLAALNSRGLNAKSFEDLKRNFSQEQQKPENTTETAEQKAEREKAFENRMLNTYLSMGGTVEQYVAMKQVAEGDLAQLSDQQIRSELKAKNFTDDEIMDILKTRYFQMEDEDIEQLEDESDKAYAKRKKEWGAERLKAYAAPLKTQAVNNLATLRKRLEEQDLLEQQEKQFSDKVSEYLKAVPRKKTFPLGKINGQELQPVDYDLTDSDIQEATKVLTDAGEREKFFFTEGGDLQHENIANLLIENRALKNALNLSFQYGETENTKKWQSVFPQNDPFGVGVGSVPPAKSGSKGKFVSKGAVEADSPSQRHRNASRNY